MKVLVFSDSHGRRELLDRMLSNEPACKEVIFLGDGMRDIEWVKEFYPDKRFTVVKGNNDWSYNISGEAYRHIEGVTLFACHGDYLGVRTSLSQVYKKASSVGASLALYGHTHVAKTSVDPLSDVTAINPGALCDGKYCVIEFKNGSFNITNKSCYD